MFTVSCNASFEGPGFFGRNSSGGRHLLGANMWALEAYCYKASDISLKLTWEYWISYSVARVGRVLLMQSFHRPFANLCNLLPVCSNLWYIGERSSHSPRYFWAVFVTNNTISQNQMHNLSKTTLTVSACLQVTYSLLPNVMKIPQPQIIHRNHPL